ncbi:MAG: tetratricopeptide repeat protein [Polaribacter sp.]
MKKNLVIFFLYTFYFSFNLLQLKGFPKNKFVTEEVSFKETSSIFLVTKDSVFLSKYKKIEKVYKSLKFADALKESLKLLEETKNKNDLENTYKISNLIADIYSKGKNQKKALEYYKKSLVFLENSYLLDNKNKSVFYTNLASSYLRIGTTYQLIKKNDSAITYYKKIENLNSLNNNILESKAFAFANLTGLYELDSLFDKAMHYANKSIKINKKINNKLGQAIVLNNLANIYMALNKFEDAKEKYKEAIAVIKNDNSEKSIRKKADFYYNLAWAMRNLKEYKAYDYQEKSYEIEDIFKDKEYRRIIEEVTAEFNINAVKKEEENKRLIAQRTFTIYGIGSFVIIISLLYFLNFYKLKQKNLSLELSQTQLLQNQNIEKIKSESQIRILNATIDGKETERKEIAETLHDSVSALLSSANLHLMATNQYFNGNTPLEISKTQEIIKEASQKIRDLSHTLVSSVLLKFGLKFAVKDLAAKYSNSNLNIETETHNIRRYEQNFEIKIYNIIQEFLNNILKHSKAKNTVIKLQEKEGAIVLQISDDGVGFDTSKIINKDGLGLNQIEARIHVLKGNFSIDSKINEGTSIIIKVPVLERTTVNHV